MIGQGSQGYYAAPAARTPQYVAAPMPPGVQQYAPQVIIAPQQYAPPQYSAPALASQKYEAAQPIAAAEPVMKKAGSAPMAKPSANMYKSIGVAMVGAAMFGLDQGNFGNVQTFPGFVDEWCVGRYDTNATCPGSNVSSTDTIVSRDFAALFQPAVESRDVTYAAVGMACPRGAEPDTHETNVAWEDGFVLWGATLITFGAAAGALALGPLLTNRFGRRPCICAGGGICFVGCLLASYLAFGSVPMFFVGRFITGFGVGVSCFALPLYNAEISTPDLRGTTGSLFQLNVVVGCFISCLITLFNHDWKFGVLLPGLAGAFLMIAAPFIPESPRFVMEKHGYEAGKMELELIRSGDVTEEAQEMMRSIEEERGVQQVSLLGLCKEANLRKRVIIACTLVACQQATGVNAFLGYAGTIFENVGIEDPLLFNTIFNSVMIFGCIAGLLLVDSKYGGRKKQLLWASAVMGPPLVLAGICLQTDEKSEWSGPIVMACVCIYGVGFQFAWGTIPWIYPAEIFSMSEKENAVSLAVFVNYVNNAVVIAITPLLMHWSVHGTMYFFGAANVACGLFVLTFIKETKGVSLEDAPGLFGAPALEGGSSEDDYE